MKQLALLYAIHSYSFTEECIKQKTKYYMNKCKDTSEYD